MHFFAEDPLYIIILNLVLLCSWLLWLDTLLDDCCNLSCVRFKLNACVSTDDLLSDDLVLCLILICNRLLVVVAEVLCPCDFTWVTLAFPHAECLTCFECHHMLVFANVDTAVTCVELVA